MYPLLRHSIAPALLATVLLLQPTANAGATEQTRQSTRSVDLVLALDVSGSMSGLIASAKQRLWDVVNEFNQAQPQPDLRVAVISYGNPQYGRPNGYVRIDQPLTRDLDAVNQALFGFQTRGGNEYVARVIARASNELSWSENDDALRVLFVAGNESATQDPQFNLHRVAAIAHSKGIVVNSIFCGNDGSGSVQAGWRAVAQQAGGLYASIDQSQSAVANIAAPQDQQLRELNATLNDTYVPYGRTGEKRRENQLRQDKNAASMSEQAAAARAVTKASSMYRAKEWDLVDAVESGVKLEEIDAKALPKPMRDMDDAQRSAFIKNKADERQALRTRIEALAADRAAHISAEQARLSNSEAAGFSDAMKQGLRSLAEQKGFTFNK